MRKGYVSIHRQLQDSDIWLNEPFTRGQAWVDLIMLANHQAGFIIIRGNRFAIKRGQCGWSKLKLADRWKWSRGKVDRFLNELIKDDQIKIVTVQQNKFLSTLISIINYEKYQNKRAADGQQKSKKTDTKTGQQKSGQTGQQKLDVSDCKQEEKTDKCKANGQQKSEKTDTKTDSRNDDKQDSNNNDLNNNKNNNKRPRKFTDDDLTVAEFIYQKILILNPSQKKPNFEIWANTVRLMRERDDRTHREICELYTWVNKHSFWKANVLCPITLRDKWDRLTIQKNDQQTNTGGQHANSGRLSAPDRVRQAQQERDRQRAQQRQREEREIDGEILERKSH